MVENLSNVVCFRPFNEIEIHTNGRVYTCCPDYLKDYYIGNIYEVESFDEIWYSDKAVKLRKSVIDGTYTHCKLDICDRRSFSKENNPSSECPEYPTLVRFSYDRQCNLQCIMCRDEKIFNTLEQQKKYDKLIDKIFLPLLKNAKIMSITSAGEITASNHSKKLLEKAARKYPNLKFEILTNGLLFNRDFCKKTNILNRMERVVVSLHAIKKDTYEKIMIGSDFNKVMSNLEWVFSMKKAGIINEVCLIFVVFSTNYKEIPEFIEYALRNGANASVWEYRRHNTEMDKNAEEYEVWEPTHPEYNDFLKVINIVKEKYKDCCRMPQHFMKL